MKSVQVRLNQDNYIGLEKMAEDDGTTVADVMRRAIILYAVAHNFKREGRKLVWEDALKNERAELIIPSITT